VPHAHHQQEPNIDPGSKTFSRTAQEIIAKPGQQFRRQPLTTSLFAVINRSNASATRREECEPMRGGRAKSRGVGKAKEE
jgi:hypothetical protein